jgi:hypothetical protein
MSELDDGLLRTRRVGLAVAQKTTRTANQIPGGRKRVHVPDLDREDGGQQ